MTEWRRHAIYFAPPEGDPLAAFGAAWLGWDPAAGLDRRDAAALDHDGAGDHLVREHQPGVGEHLLPDLHVVWHGPGT